MMRLAFTCAALAAICLTSSVPARAQPVTAQVDTCFVPAQRCLPRITAAIDAAQHAIRVEAYGFTSRLIIAALIRARARGVDVAILLDKSDAGRFRVLDALHAGGIPVWIDRVSGIAHIKAIEIDGREVIGGSYNFTWSAEHLNVEDVTIIDSPEIAARFLRHWTERAARAEAAE